ncbi:hypothetical protein QBC34DRAFT_424727 [Podospora aff. communis PSN243]|uniref:Uncharacterized protein n=1 Tax=Podospora aff. communis PSN243 TaxID=3040156 RepID=A0AAV9GQS3_9PEZI|nr:hypothetical protein QBC34DRAFT_424727 [Podospora aff. communis PSN243]
MLAFLGSREMLFSSGIKCTFSEQPTQVTPNADLGGPLLTAVVISTSFLTVGLTAVYYLFALDPNRNSSGGEYAANWVDVAVARLGRRIADRPIFRRLQGKTGGTEVLARSILILCDLQTLVGLSLLIGGVLNLPKGISAYHFMLVAQTAWFSHVAQLTTLSVLRHTKHSLVAKWARILVTVAFTVMLIKAILPTIFFAWAYTRHFSDAFKDTDSLQYFPGGSASLPGTPALCFYDFPQSLRWHYESSSLAWTFTDTPAFGSAVLSIVAIVLNLAVRFLRLEGWLDRPVLFVRRAISNKWKSLFAAAAEDESRIQQLVAHIGLATLLTTRLFADLFVSSLSDIFWIIVPAVYGTITLLRARSAFNIQESPWTYGQILPMLLLIGAIIVLVWTFISFRSGPTALPLSQPPQQYTDDGPSSGTLPATSSPHQDDEVPLMREATPVFEREYTNPNTTPWASAAIALPSANLALFTAFYFRYLYDRQPNAASLLVHFLIPVLVGIPVASYVFTLLSLGYQSVRSPEQSTKKAYWGISSAVWAGSGGLYAFALYLGPWQMFHILNYIIIGFGGLAVLVNVAAAMVARPGGRRGMLAI